MDQLLVFAVQMSRRDDQIISAVHLLLVRRWVELWTCWILSRKYITNAQFSRRCDSVSLLVIRGVAILAKIMPHMAQLAAQGN